MRFRTLDADGDMTFGHGAFNYLVDSPEAVAQAIRSRLLLMRAEWFLDVSEGTPYAEILGTGTAGTYDHAIRARILETAGVTAIVTYSSRLADRALTVTAQVQTAYGPTEFEVAL